jgi:O-antigen ligase
MGTLVPIALAPVLLGLLAWDTASLRTPVQDWIRLTGVPVAGVELLVILVALRCGFEPFRVLRKAPLWARVALVVLILIAFANALVVAVDPLTSALRSSMALVHLLFALGVSHMVSVSDEWRGNAPWIAIMAGMGAYLALLALFVAMIPAPGQFDWLTLGLGVMNIRHVGFFAAVGAAAALGLAAGAAIIRFYLASLAATAIMFGLAFWTGSRGPITGVLGASVVALALIPAFRTRRAVIAIVTSVPTGALLSLIHSVPNPHYGIARLAESASNVSVGELSSGRMELWAGTWRAILKRPLLGHGEGQLAMVVPEAKGIFHHPHNAFLQVIFQWGFVGAICVAGLTLLVGWHFFKNARVVGLPLICPFLIATTLLIMSLHDGTLFFGFPLMMIALCLGVLGTERSALPVPARAA